MPDRYCYTFILEFRGGTYLKQVIADDLLDAFQRWFGLLREGDLPEFGGNIADGFIQSYEDEGPPVSVTGLEFVWCTTALVGNDSAMVHVVRGAAT